MTSDNPTKNQEVEMSFPRAWWDKAHTLELITPEELATLPAGTVLGSISGQTVEVGKDSIDNDTRFGFLAYGFQHNRD